MQYSQTTGVPTRTTSVKAFSASALARCCRQGGQVPPYKPLNVGHHTAWHTTGSSANMVHHDVATASLLAPLLSTSWSILRPGHTDSCFAVQVSKARILGRLMRWLPELY